MSIVATGASVPNTVVSNDELSALGCDSEWIVKRTGILERRQAESPIATSDLALEAATRCLEQCGLQPADIDLVICATMTPDHATPSTACLLQQRLGCIAPAFDLNAACSGFVYGLITGAQYVRTGMARNALIVGAETMSRTVNRADKQTYPLFGDGAGAVILQPAMEREEFGPGIVSYCLGSEGSTESLCVPAGGSREPLTFEAMNSGRQYLKMDGRTVFKWAVRVVTDSCLDVLAAAHLSPEDVDLLVLHQANVRILEGAAKGLGVPMDKFVVNLDRYGNTSAASIPLALDEAYRQGRLKRGDRILMSGFGAGLCWGTALIRW